MHPNTLSSKLLAHMQSSSNQELRVGLQLLQQWLSQNIRSFSADLRKKAELDKYAELDLSQYLVEEAPLELEVELRQMARFPADSMEWLAFRISGLFWDGITLESEVDCPRCRIGPLRVFVDPPTDAIVFCCDLCAWSQFPQGQIWKGANYLQAPSRERIERWRRTGK